MTPAWFAPLAGIAARGELTPNTGGLAGLAEARRIHEGQFFTPPAVVAVVWALLGKALDPRPVARGLTRPCRVIDTAAGSGRLLWPCDPERHEVWAIECDGDCAGPLASAHVVAGFAGTVIHGRMEEHRLVGEGFDVALLNPPFSLHFDAPLLERFSGNAHGRYGAQSSAISHWYALEQARRGAGVVAAIVPRSVAIALQESTRDGRDDLRRDLRAVVHLPSTAFATAGADVETAIVVFAPAISLATTTVQCQTLARVDPSAVEPIPWLVLPCAHRPASVIPADVDPSQPSVTLPVTLDWRVRIARAGRRLVLGFHCGAAQAIVLNRILGSVLARPQRGQAARPASIRYRGQGALDLEVHLAQPYPSASLAELVATITRCGMRVELDAGIMPFLRRRARRYARESIPVRRWIWHPEGGEPAVWLAGQTSVRATARVDLALGQIRVPAGATISLFRGSVPAGQDKPRWVCPHPTEPGIKADIPHSHVLRAFNLPDCPQGGWQLRHPGLRVHAPEAWQAAERHARACGVDRFLTRGYQFEDAVELHARGRGICGWLMALGKARLAIALALMGGSHNLIVVEARLVDEMVRELRTIGLPDDLWQVITSVTDTRNLRKVNLIAYSRLKMPIGGYGSAGESDRDAITTEMQAVKIRELRRSVRWRVDVPAHSGMPKAEIAERLRRLIEERANPVRSPRMAAHRSRDCIARHLRHRIHTLVADEAHCLRNQTSDQTRACLLVAPKRAFDLSGTPIANYPRDILPLLRHVGGDGTVVQPYGQFHPLLEADQRRSMQRAQSGNGAFADMFCVLEWVTNEWLDNMQEGAKREIPKIKDVPGFRRLVDPYIVRRVHHEPDVNLPIPVPTITTTVLPWEIAHLRHYLAVAERFSTWYAEEMKRRGNQRPNLAVLLAKIGAVVHANNHPQDHRGGPSVYAGPWTTKQRTCLDRLTDWTAAGHKTICFMHNPRLVDQFRIALADRGIEAVSMHGQIPIQVRLRELDRRFREGPAPVLLATYGVARQGLNIHQADRVLQYSRDWTASAEEQGMYRVLRPQQTRPVLVERLHHEGSIDIYQDQMVAFKSNALAAGLDYGDEDPDAEFLHYETIFSRFIDGLDELSRRKVA